MNKLDFLNCPPFLIDGFYNLTIGNSNLSSKVGTKLKYMNENSYYYGINITTRL